MTERETLAADHFWLKAQEETFAKLWDNDADAVYDAHRADETVSQKSDVYNETN
jgi:hypothetical protein